MHEWDDEPGEWFTLDLLQWSLARDLAYRHLGELARYDPEVEVFPIARIWNGAVYIRVTVVPKFEIDRITIELSI